MLAVGLTRVGRGEDACQTTVLRDEHAADVMRDHVFENFIEPRTAIDDIRLRHVDIVDEQLIPRRQGRPRDRPPVSHLGPRRRRQACDVQYRKVSDLVFDHPPVRMTHAVADIDRARKGGHHRRNGRNVVHAVC
jgi:hypothetical protein